MFYIELPSVHHSIQLLTMDSQAALIENSEGIDQKTSSEAS